MRTTNQAIINAETAKVSHMPIRCRRVARVASGSGSGSQDLHDIVARGTRHECVTGDFLAPDVVEEAIRAATW